MLILNELITPFNEEKEIDISLFNQLIDKSIKNGNDYQIIFSPIGDGFLLTNEEKKAIINSINSEKIKKVIYYLQLESFEKDKEMIEFLNTSLIETILLCPPNNFFYHQNGLFLYIKNILKKLKNKSIILVNSPSHSQITFHFQTIKKLFKLNSNIIGLYENSKDISLMSLIKQNFPTLKIFVNERMIEQALLSNYDGIISGSSLIFGLDYLQVIKDYNHKYLNRLLLDYLLFVNEILSFSNNSTLFKAYLKKLGYKSMEVRLPLIIDKADIENIEFLLS